MSNTARPDGETDDRNPSDNDATQNSSTADHVDGAADARSNAESNVESNVESNAAAESPSHAADQTTEVNLGQEMVDALRKASENWDLYLRAKAEADNVRRRAERDVSNAHKYALEKFATEILAVVDSLELGLAAARGDESVTDAAATTPAEPNAAADKIAEGMELTLKMLTGTLEKFSITPIDPINQPFDPDAHQAMSMVDRDDVDANTVVAVMQKGYRLNDRVIRPAMVMVSRKA